MILQTKRNIAKFKDASIDHTLTLEASSNIEEIQKKLENITYQPVLVESIGQNKYRILLRCPPDKYDQISGWIKKKSEPEE